MAIAQGRQFIDSIGGVLRRGGVGILPTDTLYGIVGSALNKKTVEKIYRLRKRNPKKPMIILIGSIRDLARFGVVLSGADKKILRSLWPGSVSVILPARARIFSYLHRGTKTLAFRLPKDRWLRLLLLKTGPLVAPSANWEGKPPAKTIAAAKKYFKDRVDFYIDSGRRDVKPSTIISLASGTVTVLRRGAVKI